LNSPRRPNRFVIFATPRSGSNWLCTLLDSHPDILCHHELFNPGGIHLAWSLRDTDFSLGDTELQQKQPLTLLQNAWSGHGGARAVGFKLNIGQSASVFEAVLDDPSILKILLRRNNRIRCFVSERIAETTGDWESYPDSTHRAPARPAVHVEAAELIAHAERNRAYLDELRSKLQSRGHAVHELAYEELGDRLTQERLLGFLGVDESVRLSGNTRKMNPGPLPELVANYDELRQAVRGTALARDLEAAEQSPS